MRHTLIPGAAVLALLTIAPAALAEGETVSAFGTGQVPITPTNRNDEASIRAAADDALAKAIPAAIADARATAVKLADASNLNLASILSVEQQAASPFFFPPPSPSGRIVGQFNGNFCGIVNRPIVRTRNGRRTVVRTVRQRRCIFPPSASTSVKVTFRAAPRV